MDNSSIVDELDGHNVIKRSRGEGQMTQIGDLRVTWKAEGKETGYQFSVDEVVLKPGFGIPFHKHPFAEFFYVVEGQIDFALMNENASVYWVSCSVGETVTVPPNAPHTFLNRSSQPSKFMGVSTYQHELMLKSGGTAVTADDPKPTRVGPEVFERAFEAFRKNQVFVVQKQ